MTIELTEYKSTPAVVELAKQIESLTEYAKNLPNDSVERKDIISKILKLSLALAKAARK